MKKLTNKVLSLIVGLSMLIPSAAVLAAEQTSAPVISATETTTLPANSCKVSVNNMNASDSVINTATWEQASDVTLAFEVPEEKAYTLTIENISRASHDAVGEMNVQIDEGETVSIGAWAKRTENGEIGTWGVPSALSYKTMVLKKGVHTIKISCTNTSIGLARIAVGKLIFEPFADLELSASETTTINAKDYLVYATNFGLNGSDKIVSDQSNGKATITIPFKVAKENVYKITIDNVSKAANTGISPLCVNVDGTEYSDTYAWTNEGAGKIGWQVPGVLSSKRFLLSEGDHTITLHIDTADGTGRYRGAIGEISFTPAEIAVVSGTESTTLNAGDYDAYGTGAVSCASAGTETQHLKFNDSTAVPSVKIPFKVDSFGSYKISVDTCSKVSHGGMSPVFVKIDNGEWAYIGTWTVIGDGSASNFGAGVSKIVSKEGFILNAGEHSIEFKVTEMTAGYYRATVGNIVFTPDTSGVSTVNAADYADGTTGYGKHSQNQNIAITYAAPGTLTVPIAVYKTGYYTLNMDLMARMSEDESSVRSWIYLAVDDGDPVKLTSDNTTLVTEEVDQYPGMQPLNNYKYKKAQYLEAGIHNLTFSVNEPCPVNAAVYGTAIKTVSATLAERFKTVSIAQRVTDYDVDSNFTINVMVDGKNISNVDAAAVTYKSSNENVATVDQQGKVTVVGMGEVEIEVAVRQFENDTAEQELKASVTYHCYENGICLYGAKATETGAEATLKTNKAVAANTVFAAKYDANNRLVDAAIVNSGEIAKNAEITLNAEFGAVENGQKVKFFVWDSNFKPLIKSVGL